MDLFDLNRVLRMEIFTSMMKNIKPNTLYKVTNIIIDDNGRKLIATINDNNGTFSLYLPQQTYAFLKRHAYLFTQMIIRARSDNLGIRAISGTSKGIEFHEL